MKLSGLICTPVTDGSITIDLVNGKYGRLTYGKNHQT